MSARSNNDDSGSRREVKYRANISEDNQNRTSWLLMIGMSIVFGVTLIWIFARSTPDPGSVPVSYGQNEDTRIVSGTVLDNTRQPLEDVRVSLLDRVEFTDEAGRFTFRIPVMDTVLKLVALRPDDSAPEIKDVRIGAENVTDITLVLEKSAPLTNAGRDRESFPAPGVKEPVPVPAGGGYKLWIDMRWQALLNKREEMEKSGFFLADVESYLASGRELYAGIWRPGGTMTRIWVAESAAGLQQKDVEFESEGFALIDIEAVNRNKKSVFLGIWSTGSGVKRHLTMGSNWDQLIRERKQLEQQSYSLADIEVYSDGKSVRYSGIWAADGAATKLWKALSLQELLNQRNRFAQEQFQLVDIEIFVEGGKKRYLGLWRPGGGEHRLWAESQWEQFRSKRNEFDQQGLDLVDLEVDDGKAFSGIWTLTAPL